MDAYLPLTAHREPTPQELDAIEREWPLITAELELVNAEVAMVAAGLLVTALDHRRLRRARRRVLAALRAQPRIANNVRADSTSEEAA